MPPSADPGPSASSAYNIPRPGKINLKETKAERAQRLYEREARKERHRRNLISRANGYAVSPPLSRSRDESITPPRFKAKPNCEDKGKGRNDNEAIHVLDDGDGSEDDIQEMGYKWMGDLGRSAKRMRVEQERMEQLEQEELMAREGDPFTSYSYSYASTSGNDVHDTGYSQSIPSRYRPTSHLRRESAPSGGAGVPEIGSMTESEYATYIRQGFSKSHREAEAAESARRAEEKRKLELEREKERLKQEKKDRRKEKERQRAFREKYAHAQGTGPGVGGPTRSGSDTDTDDGKGRKGTSKQRTGDEYQAFKRDRYISRWATLNQRPDGTEIQEVEMKYTDIPWPSYSQSLEKEDIRIFLYDTSQSQESGDLRKTLRKTIRIYHPDKFLGRFLGRVREGDREKVKEGVERVSRAINDLMGELGR